MDGRNLTMRTLVLALALAMTGCGLMQQLEDASYRPHPTGLTPKQRWDTAAAVSFTGFLYMASQFGDRGKDKYEHCAAGLTSSLTVGLIWQPNDGWLVGVGLGALKEGVDAMGYGTPDFTDFAVTAACATAGTGLLKAASK